MIYCVYIMTNKINTVLYTGFSSDLPGRVMNHKNKVVKGFTKRYNVNKLVYYETCECREGALFREKQIKAGSRQDKMDLIDSVNPKWEDLSGKL
ncbi:MAG: GIY-YIG nuclease family protein [Dehalococcoidales bacterium]|jgi:putative endonuclease